jgi:hypothetical protein
MPAVGDPDDTALWSSMPGFGPKSILIVTLPEIYKTFTSVKQDTFYNTDFDIFDLLDSN